MLQTVPSGRRDASFPIGTKAPAGSREAWAGQFGRAAGRTAAGIAPGITRWLVGGLAVAGTAGLVAFGTGDLGAWIGDKAHTLAHALDRCVAAVARGDAGAWTALLGGSALYGFLHALGPGHGKVLVGGVGAGSSVTARRLMALSFAAGLAQAMWAIALVYGALAILGLSIGAVTGLARDVLAPLGAALIVGIAALMLWRTLAPIVKAPIARRWVRGRSTRAAAHACGHDAADHAHHGHARYGHGHQHHHGHRQHTHHDHAQGGCAHHHRAHASHDHDHGGHDPGGHDHGDCSCAHAPTLDAVARLERPWDAVTLVAGIAVRPCTSALVVLALAWQAGVPSAGALAALSMGLGTATLVCLVAGSSVFARRMALLGSAGPVAHVHLALRVVAGTTLALLGLTMLAAAI